MAGEDTPTTTPPLFTQAELSGSTAPGTASLDWTTILALFAFVGTVVRCPHASVARRSPPLMPKLVALAAGLLCRAGARQPATDLLCGAQRRVRACRRRRATVQAQAESEG